MNCLSLFAHFVGLAFKGLSIRHFQCYWLILIFWIFADALRFLISRWTCFFTICLYDVRSLILTCSQFQQQQQRIFFLLEFSSSLFVKHRILLNYKKLLKQGIQCRCFCKFLGTFCRSAILKTTSWWLFLEVPLRWTVTSKKS